MGSRCVKAKIIWYGVGIALFLHPYFVNFMNHYETVFILNRLSEDQIKEAVNKFTTLLSGQGAEFVNQEDWGLKN